MITFLINLDGDKDSIELTKLYFYPYLKEQKIRMINSQNISSDEIFNEIKYYIHNNSTLKKTNKEFQIIFVIPVYDEKSLYFKGNIVNRVIGIKDELFMKLSEEKLEPYGVNIITIDNLERDFKKISFDVNGAISEELDNKGYLEMPVIIDEDMCEIEGEWNLLVEKLSTKNFSSNSYEKLSETEKDEIDKLKEIFYKIDDVIKGKVDEVEQDKIGKLEDSAIRSHLKKYDVFRKKLKNELEHDFKMRIESVHKLDIRNVMLSILKKEKYYYEYLFDKKDIEKLQKIWEEKSPTLSDEELYNLSKSYMEKLKKVKEAIEKSIDEIIEKKSDGLKALGLKPLETAGNIYLDRRTLRQIGERFKERFIRKKIDLVLEKGSLKEGRIPSPADIFKDLLKETYSLERISGINNCKIFRVSFEKQNSLKYNENLLKLSYFILFLVEYAEKKENYMMHNKYFYLEDIQYKKNYNEKIFSRYIEILQREEKRINAEKDKLKNSANIDYYTETQESFNDLTNLKYISSLDPPHFKGIYYPNEISRYSRDWLYEMDEAIGNYIEAAREALIDYQTNKNRFLTIPRHKQNIEKNIEQEVREKYSHLEELRKQLSEIEEKVKTDIKNEWLHKIAQEVSQSQLKSLLEKRPAVKDIVKLLTISFIPILVYGYYANTSALLLAAINSGIMFLIIGVFIFVNLGVLKSEIRDLMNTAKYVRDEYAGSLAKIMDIKRYHIDKETEVRVAEKNYQLAKKEEKFINEQLELLEYYKNQIMEHCQNAEELKRIIGNISNVNIDEIEYKNEGFNAKVEEIDYKRAPFENDRFNPCKYIEISQYRDFIVYIDQQENNVSPQNLFGCHSISLEEDKIYSGAVV